jgi:endonuclease/exonuclease/phosphatase family metal-dependent hydrolase
MLNYPLEGGALTGLAELGLPEPPYPESFVAMGDFNMLEGSHEYHALCGRPDHEFGAPLAAKRTVDAAARLAGDGERATTWVHPDHPRDTSRYKRIDYFFVSPNLAPLLKASHVDAEAVGSDHQPLWVEFG